MRKRILLLIIIFVITGTFDSVGQIKQQSKSKTYKTKVKKEDKALRTSIEAKKKQQETQKEIQQTEAQLKENDLKVSRSLNELGKLEGEIKVTTGKINELTLKIKKLDGDINQLEEEINKNEGELLRLREEYLKAIKKMRIVRKNNSTLTYIFASKSLNQAWRRLRYLREFSNWRSRTSAEIDSKITQLKGEKSALDKAVKEQEVALVSQRNHEKKLTQQKTKQEHLIAELKQNGKALESHLKRKQAEAKELGNTIANLIAKEQQKALEEKAKEEIDKKASTQTHTNETTLTKEPVTTAKSDKTLTTETNHSSAAKKTEEPKIKSDRGKEEKSIEFANARKRVPRGKESKGNGNKEEIKELKFEGMKGKLPYPVTGKFIITSGFGRQNLPDLPGVEIDNPGIDAETDKGTHATAVFNGMVSGVYLLPGYNTVVIVNHGDYYTVYGNIATPSVKTGDSVEPGSKLGVLAPCEDNNDVSSIHFEVWKNREKLNPEGWLR